DNLPAGASLDPVTGRFTWTPALHHAGTYNLTFTVSEGHSSDSETITLTVENANQAPVFTPMITQLARENAELRFTVVAGDPDDDPVSLSVISDLPLGALFVPSTGAFIWTPGFDQQGEHQITFAAQDPHGG